MFDTKQFNYKIDAVDPAPQPGEYLVWVGKRGILHVMAIKSVRKVNHKKITDSQTYALEAYNRPDLKPYAEYEQRWHGLNVWVRGEPALPCVWLPRNAKS